MEPSPQSVLSLTTCLEASPYLNCVRSCPLSSDIVPWFRQPPKAVEPETVTATRGSVPPPSWSLITGKVQASQ